MTFEQLVEAAQGIRVLVVGDHYLDRNSIGKYRGYSREQEQKPIFKIEHEQYGPGGAGHLASNITMTGAKVAVAGFWGRADDDYNRNILEKEFANLSINVDCMVVASRTPTYEKTYFVHGDHETRLDLDPDEIVGSAYQDLIDMIEHPAYVADVIVVADYDETARGGVCTPEVLRAISNLNVPTYGTSRIHINRFSRFDQLIVNQKELLDAVSEGDTTTDTCAALLLINKIANTLVVTLSGQGVDVYEKDPTVELDSGNPVLAKMRVPSLPVDGRIDTCGAGDAFLAWYIVANMCGLDVAASASFGNAAARAECKLLYGASPVLPLDVQISCAEMLKALQS